MLAAMEDLLDTWPGPLIVVSHDRYLLERVTDTQYAVLNGTVRHVPGGVQQYLELRAEADAKGTVQTTGGRRATSSAAGTGSGTDKGAGAGSDSGSGSGSGSGTGGSTRSATGAATGSGGAEAHAARKELSATERRMEKLMGQTKKLHERLAAHDQSDYQGLQSITEELRAIESQVTGLEERWLELSEQID